MTVALQCHGSGMHKCDLSCLVCVCCSAEHSACKGSGMHHAQCMRCASCVCRAAIRTHRVLLRGPGRTLDLIFQ